MNEKPDDMKISVDVTKEQDCRRRISVEVAPGHLLDEKERVLGEMAGTVSLPGFRKGKVPRDVVRRRFAGEIESEALKAMLPRVYGQAVRSENLAPVGQPVFSDIKVAEGEPLTFCVDVEVAPEIELGSYKDLEVPIEENEVTDDEVREVLGTLQERNADYVPVDRGAVTNDVVILDYAPLGLDGEIEESKQVADYPVQIGAGQIFPSFEEQIKGKPAGGRGEVEIEYPDDYRPEHLAGKKVIYRFTVKEVREKRVQKLDDEFARKIDEQFATLEQLKADIRKRLEEERIKEARRKREETAIDMLIERHPFEIPRSMIDHYKQQLLAEDKRRREAMGAPPDKDEGRLQQLDELFEKIAARNIRRFFLLDHIAGLEQVTVSREEVEQEIESIAERSGKELGEVKTVFQQGSDNLSSLKNQLRERKLFELILSAAG